ASAAHFAQSGNGQQLEQRRALVVADPTCDLPASIAEAEAATRHLSQLGFAVERLQRKAATEESIVGNLKGAGIFHFCGHGLSDSYHPTRAALFVHPDFSRLSAEAVRRSVDAGADPLQALPSGVSKWQEIDEYERLTDLPGIGRLYEVQYPASKIIDRRLEYGGRGTLWRRYRDGAPTPLVELWTAGDILVQESMSDCRLAFLSACEAGSGGLSVTADEYSGLPAALQLAGVSTIICSLWPVSDALTTFYVDLFYEALVQAAPQVNIAALIRDINARLRQMKKDEAIALLDQLRRRSSDSMARITLEIFIEEVKEGDGLPFQNPYDWAAFYVTGTGDITFAKENSHEDD
ncbi:MAG TPA: CHAT domain-containing protein, partial [Pyrinomonadaceae bacterium]|nr:CHAT domain-containing protein [Pyrinomonadaceae bacterium]